MKTHVLIPVYNAEKYIRKIVEDLISIDLDVLVVNDGSLDKTELEAKNGGAKVLRHETNRGKGAAIITGIKFLLDNTDFDYLILLDGDGQHDISFCSNFIKAADEMNADIIIGNRMHNTKQMPMIRLAVNKFTSFLISKLTNIVVFDCQSGFRLLKRKLLEKVIFTAEHYDIECEMIIKTSYAGFKIGHINIESIYGVQKSYINPIIDTLRFIKLILKELFRNT